MPVMVPGVTRARRGRGQAHSRARLARSARLQPRGRRADPVMGPLEQPHAELVFQCPNLPGDCGCTTRSNSAALVTLPTSTTVTTAFSCLTSMANFPAIPPQHGSMTKQYFTNERSWPVHDGCNTIKGVRQDMDWAGLTGEETAIVAARAGVHGPGGATGGARAGARQCVPGEADRADEGSGNSSGSRSRNPGARPRCQRSATPL